MGNLPALNEQLQTLAGWYRYEGENEKHDFNIER